MATPTEYIVHAGSHIEIERRFLLKKKPEGLDQLPHHHIVQGYFDCSADVSARVRLIDGSVAELTKKYRHNGQRVEVNEPLGTAAARLLLDKSITAVIEKIRYYRDGWEIDVFHGTLEGLLLAEKELASEHEPLTIPAWLDIEQEVTKSISNRMLAQIARTIGDKSIDRPILEYIQHRTPRIVLTGGPCSGKTTIMDYLRRDYGNDLHYVPETASIIMCQIGVRPPHEPRAYEEFQRTIYRIQRGLETITDFQAFRDEKKAVILDRGTVDGAAYLENGTAQLEDICRTSVIHHEYDHYDLVLHLASPSQKIYELNRGNNPARATTNETYDQAITAGKRLHKVWEKHPSFIAIDDFENFDEKYLAVRRAIERFLQQKDRGMRTEST